MKKLAILFFFTFTFSSLFSATHTWIGGASGDWNTTSNWSNGVIPPANDDVIINTATTIDVSTATFPIFPNGFNKMTISANVIFVCNVIPPAFKTINFNSTATGGFSITAGSKLTVKGTTTDVNGAFTNGSLRIDLSNGVNVIDGILEMAGSSSRLGIGSNTTVTLNGTLAFYPNSSNISASFPSTLNVGATGVYIVSKNGGSIPAANWNVASKILLLGSRSLTGTVIPSGTNALPFVAGSTPYNLPNVEIDVPNATGIVNMSLPSNLVIKGNLDIKNFIGGTLRFAASLNNTVVEGNMTVATGVTVNLNNSGSSPFAPYVIGTMLGGSLTVNGNLNVVGNLDLQATSGGGCDIIVKGDLIAPGRVYASAATPGLMNIYMKNGGMKTLTMPNTDAQNIRLSVINNSMVTLGSSVDTLRGIQLLAGDNKIILGNFNLVVRGESPVPSNTGITGGATNYIVTNGTGMVTMTGIANNFIGKTFHIASANGMTYFYDPVSIVPTSAPATFSVNVKRSISNPVLQSSQVAPLEWMITSSTPAVADVIFTADATALATFTPSNVILGRWNGTAWEEIFQGISWTSPSMTAPALSSFNKFVLGNACSFVPPPVSTTLAASNTRLCESSTVNLTSTGGSADTFQWESQAECTGPWTAFGSATSGATSVTPLTTTCYRVSATRGACPTAYSNVQSVLVDMPAVGGLLTLSTNTSIIRSAICPDGSVTLKVSGYTGKIASWQINPITSPVWKDIANTKDKMTLDVNGSSLTTTTFYRVCICSPLGICTGSKAVAYASVFRVSLKANCAPPPPAPSLVNKNKKDGITTGVTNAYPSPTNSQISLNIEGAAEGDAQIEIVDVTGKTALKETRFLQEGSNEVSLSINTLANGIYIVRFTDNAKQQSIVKIVKEN
jgi:Secretion system C-terminal sorting domain